MVTIISVFARNPLRAESSRAQSDGCNGAKESVMTITFDELCQILAREKSLSPDFWLKDPLYIQLGAGTDRQVSTTEPFGVSDGTSIGIDVNAEGEALGIEFLPI